MMSSKKFLIVGAVLSAAVLAGCSDEQSAEAVAMGQFKTACKGGNLQACNGILQHEQMNRTDAARASAQMAGASTSSTGF